MAFVILMTINIVTIVLYYLIESLFPNLSDFHVFSKELVKGISKNNLSNRHECITSLKEKKS